MAGQDQPLLEIKRNLVVESSHLGSIAILDSNGKLLASYGDPYKVAFLRSSAKPFQALPFVENGGVEHYHYTPRELALSCSSHETAQIHLDAVSALQKKTAVEEKYLQCGPHLPSDSSKLREVIQKDIKPTSNFNNCSGKHTTMLAYSKMRGFSLENYLDIKHPHQQEILTAISEMCTIEREKIELGIDGCSAPNFAMPLYNAALGIARLCDPRELNTTRANACKQITSAMMAHSEMVSGVGEFDAELMKIGNGKIFSKRGAEGFQIIGILPNENKPGIGIAFKVADGDPAHMNDDLASKPRVRPAVSLEILHQLGALDNAQLQSLSAFGPKKISKNYAGITTGESYPAFKLNFV